MARLEPQHPKTLPRTVSNEPQSVDLETEDKAFDPALHRALIQQKRGNYEIAYNQLKLLESREVLAEHAKLLRIEIYACIEKISNIFLIESIEALRQDIVRYRALPHRSGSSINELCIQLIRFKYQSESGEVFSLTQITEDEFLLDCLANDYFPDPEIEKFLTDIRRQLLLSSVKDLAISEAYLPLYQAIAFQGYLTDYVFFMREDEREIVSSLDEELGTMLGGQECALQDITNLMLLLSMYQPLISSNANPALHGLLAEQMPEYLQAIFSLTYLEALDLESRASKVVALGEINEQSEPVRQQYEESPHPKYGRLNYQLYPISYRAMNPPLANPAMDTSVLNNNPLEILIAGCGTGFHALQVAMSCENARVTAIDISRKSIAYGQRLKAAYGANNIDFFQADVLEIPSIFNAQRQRFHVIESIGVLHHMEDMEAGLAALTRMLVPGGILNLGLYSKMARTAIDDIRRINARIGVNPTCSNIRQFRKQVMMSEANDSIKTLLRCRDFYNLHGCRDLLFNTQETCLTIPELERLLESQKLRFLGFYFADDEARRHYQCMFPAAKTMHHLPFWHQLELQHPRTFKGMYRFHCQTQ